MVRLIHQPVVYHAQSYYEKLGKSEFAKAKLQISERQQYVTVIIISCYSVTFLFFFKKSCDPKDSLICSCFCSCAKK